MFNIRRNTAITYYALRIASYALRVASYAFFETCGAIRLTPIAPYGLRLTALERIVGHFLHALKS
ncbi:MAG: hypothetical protein LUQ06_01275, partial [Methylococcaceae bacterium]|nr:hypothetical protein [Methylococcaceae bacterium]